MIVLCNRLYIATGRLFLDVCRLEDCRPGKKTANEKADAPLDPACDSL
jgi:hypothetical protein